MDLTQSTLRCVLPLTSSLTNTLPLLPTLCTFLPAFWKKVVRCMTLQQSSCIIFNKSYFFAACHTADTVQSHSQMWQLLKEDYGIFQPKPYFPNYYLTNNATDKCHILCLSKGSGKNCLFGISLIMFEELRQKTKQESDWIHTGVLFKWRFLFWRFTFSKFWK